MHVQIKIVRVEYDAKIVKLQYHHFVINVKQQRQHKSLTQTE